MSPKTFLNTAGNTFVPLQPKRNMDDSGKY